MPTLVEDAVSAATVSAVSQVMDTAVHGFDRRRRADHYRDLILDGASVRLRLVGQVQRRIGSVRLRPPPAGHQELMDLQLVNAEAQDTRYGFLWRLWIWGLHGDFLELIAPDAQWDSSGQWAGFGRPCRSTATGRKSGGRNVIKRLFLEVRRRLRPLCAFGSRGGWGRSLFRHLLPAFTQDS